jgi:lipoprotein-anchoring transpeptidase ErfK/SrfK
MPLKKLLVFITSISFLSGLIYLQWYQSKRSSPPNLKVENVLQSGVKIGDLNLGNLTVQEATNRLEEYSHKTTLVTFPHRAQRFTYEDLGITFNFSVLTDYLRSCEKRLFTCEEKQYPIPLGERLLSLNEAVFEGFVVSLNQQVSSLLSSNDISFDDLTFRAHDPEASIQVDGAQLRQQLKSEKVFSQQVIDVHTIIKENHNFEAQSEATATLVVKFGRQPLYISSETLSSFITQNEVENFSTAVVSKEAISAFLAELAKEYPLEIELEERYAVLSVAHALLFRAGGENPTTAVILPLKGESSTKGLVANKYLELNKSQQRMYAFEGREVIDTYIVGTGLIWETPPGNFQILRKEGTAISYTGNWFMPYYMPIGTVNGYFFGFHEVPYKKDAYGNITSRDLNTMGSPATGGCIQLYREDSAQIYQWAEVGMPVIIIE